MSEQLLVLTGESTPIRVLIGDLWRKRHLLRMFAEKDFHSRYRSAALGIVWSVALPVLQGAVFAVLFTYVVKVDVGRSSTYPIFVLSGTAIWSYVSQSMLAGTSAIVDQASIASKVYFPRLILPAVPALSNSVSLAVTMGVVIVLMPIFGVGYHPTIVLLPLAMVLAAATAVVASAVLCILHVYFRDVKYIVQAGLMVGIYATPVIYPLERARGLRPLLLLNPVTGVVQLTRFAIFGEATDVGIALVTSLTIVVVLFGTALLAYRRHERVAADRL